MPFASLSSMNLRHRSLWLPSALSGICLQSPDSLPPKVSCRRPRARRRGVSAEPGFRLGSPRDLSFLPGFSVSIRSTAPRSSCRNREGTPALLRYLP